MNTLIDKLGEATAKYYDKILMDTLTTPLSYFKEPPVKFWYEPIFTIKVPHIYSDYENYDEDGNDGGRKGLFFEWKEIGIGKRKIINKNYNKELKEYNKWKKSTSTIKWSRYNPL